MTKEADTPPKRSSSRRMLRTDAQSIAYFGDPFRPLEPECKVVQFEQALTDEQLRRTGALVADRPDIQLYIYGRATRDLDFLRHFPTIRRLHVALWEVEDVSGLGAAMPQLSDLTFGRTKKQFPLGGSKAFVFQLDILNIFNAVNFNPVFNPGSGATIFQVNSAYQDISGTYDPGGRLMQLVFRINW